MTRRVTISLALAACAAAAELLVATPAQASCAASPPVSPRPFSGVVLATSRGGVDARVRTTDGTVVEVIGSPADGDVRTTVDRTYRVGAWYAFAPVNATSPFRDNACTATRELAQAPTVSATSSRRRAAAPAATTSRGDQAAWPWAVGATAGLAAVVGVVFALRRRARAGGRT